MSDDVSYGKSSSLTQFLHLEQTSGGFLYSVLKIKTTTITNTIKKTTKNIIYSYINKITSD